MELTTSFNKRYKIYKDFLADIGGIRFTMREIDIIACIYHNRKGQSISSVLSISSRTVSTHTYNIRGKLGYISQHLLIDFIEKSGKIAYLRQYYVCLLLQNVFHAYLRKVAQSSNKIPIHCNLSYEATEKQGSTLAMHIKHDLRIANIVCEDMSSINKEEVKYNISIISELPSIRPANRNQILLLCSKEPISLHNEELPCLDFSDDEAYYLSCFLLIKQLTNSPALDIIIQEFKKEYDVVKGIGSEFMVANHNIEISPKLTTKSLEDIFRPLIGPKLWPTVRLFIYIIAIGIFAYKSWFFFYGDKEIRFSTDRRDIVHLSQYENIKPVRAEFKLPKNLLEREDIIQPILERFNADKDTISLVGVVGIGGVGKTTIAHKVGKLWEEVYPSAHVFEINAETPTTIRASFRNLAIGLAQNDKLKAELSFIDKIPDMDKKAMRLISFIQPLLKEGSNWLLIFDNVESFNDIAPYLPEDASIWGHGKVIITTRNNHIRDSEYIKSEDMIYIDKLSESEALDLFINTYRSSAETLSEEGYVRVKKFLEGIPPFPHDINIAARYIRNHYISLEEYLRRMEGHHNEFYISQELLLRETSQYTKDRYSIITLPLKQIIDKNKYFKELLFLITLIDSHYIPKELLEAYSNKQIADSLLHEMKKYSLITEEEKYNLPTFSLHNSTQDILRSYLTGSPGRLEAGMRDIIGDKLKVYMFNAIEREDLSLIMILERHCEQLASIKDLNGRLKSTLSIILGLMNYSIGKNDLKAAALIEQGASFKEFIKSDYLIKARGLAYLGTIYTRLGDFKKAFNALDECLTLYKNYNIEDPYGLSRALNSMAFIYILTDEYGKAEEILKHSISVSSKGAQPNTNLARAYLYLGIVYKEVGNYPKAEASILKNIELRLSPSPDVISYAWAQGFLGALYEATGRDTQAREVLENSIYTYVYNSNGRVGSLEWFLPDLISVYYHIGEYQKAQEILDQIERTYKKLPSEPLYKGRHIAHLGKLYHKIGYYDKAEELLKQSKHYQLKIFGADSLRACWIDTLLGQLYITLGRYDEARISLENSLVIYKNRLPSNHIKVAKAKMILGYAYYHLGDLVKARSFLAETLVVYQAHYGKYHLRMADIFRYLGELHLSEGDIQQAETFLSLSLEILKKHNHPDQHLSYESLSKLYKYKAIEYRKQRDNTNARKCLKQSRRYLRNAHAIINTSFPSDSGYMKRINNMLAEKHLYK